MAEQRKLPEKDYDILIIEEKQREMEISDKSSSRISDMGCNSKLGLPEDNDETVDLPELSSDRLENNKEENSSVRFFFLYKDLDLRVENLVNLWLVLT